MKVNFSPPRNVDPEVAKALDLLFKALQKRLTVEDNLAAAIVDLDFSEALELTHGVERAIPDTLGFKPSGFTPWHAEDEDGRPMEIASCLFNPRPRDANGQVIKDRVGVKLRFAWEGPYAEFQPTADQTIGTAANTPVTWTEDLADVEGVISLASNSAGPATSRIVVSEPGIYALSGNISYDNNNTNAREIFTAQNVGYSGTSADYDVVEHRGEHDTPGTTIAPTTLPILAEWPLSAGDYVEVVTWQNSGGDRTLDGTTIYRSKLRVRRVGRTRETKGRVIGVLWGG